MEALAEPIAAKRESTPARAPELKIAPEPLMPRVSELDTMLTHRPEGRPSLPTEVEVIPAAPLTPRPHAVREPTLSFDTGVRGHQTQVEIGGFEARAEPSVTVPAPAPIQQPELLLAPSQRLEPSPLSAAAAPARAVSAPRIEAPKSFGELLELSLGLRPQ